MKKIFIIIAVSSLLISPCAAYEVAKSKTISVSLTALISNPENYHGKLVRVIGVANIGFEVNGIWLTKEHFDHGISKNSLWIEPNYEVLDASPEKLMEYNGKYVLMEGLFNKDHKGHLGMKSGALENVTRYMLWEKDNK